MSTSAETDVQRSDDTVGAAASIQPSQDDGTQPDAGCLPSAHEVTPNDGSLPSAHTEQAEPNGIHPMDGSLPSAHVEKQVVRPMDGSLPSAHVAKKDDAGG